MPVCRKILQLGLPGHSGLHQQALASRQGQYAHVPFPGKAVKGLALIDVDLPAVVIEQHESAERQPGPQVLGGGDLGNGVVHVDMRKAEPLGLDVAERIRHKPPDDRYLRKILEGGQHVLVALRVVLLEIFVMELLRSDRTETGMP